MFLLKYKRNKWIIKKFMNRYRYHSYQIVTKNDEQYEIINCYVFVSEITFHFETPHKTSFNVTEQKIVSRISRE